MTKNLRLCGTMGEVMTLGTPASVFVVNCELINLKWSKRSSNSCTVRMYNNYCRAEHSS